MGATTVCVSKSTPRGDSDVKLPSHQSRVPQLHDMCPPCEDDDPVVKHALRRQ
mgnify:CR=1 FL=1